MTTHPPPTCISILHNGDLYKFYIDPLTEECGRVELYPDSKVSRPHLERFSDLDPVLIEKYETKLLKPKCSI